MIALTLERLNLFDTLRQCAFELTKFLGKLVLRKVRLAGTLAHFDNLALEIGYACVLGVERLNALLGFLEFTAQTLEAILLLVEVGIFRPELFVQ